MTDRCCIIGAGPAGLLAARALRLAGIPYDQIEKNPGVGGIWDIRNDWSPMYESAHFISSKTVSNLPGFAMPESYPDYPNHRQILAYLESFARHYDLLDDIRFETTVERVERRSGGGWRVRSDDGTERDYRALFICSGNTWDPNLPKYAGELSVEQMHSVRYRDPEVFRGKRVLVVGGGNSGCDIACDAATHAKKAFISLRRGYHFIPKYILGEPADLFASRVELPPAVERPLFAGLLKLLVGDLTRFGLPKPDHRVMESHPIMNTQVLHHLGHGDLTCKPDIERLEGNRVRFADGSVEEVDLVVFATGYLVTYPFMDKKHFDWIQKYPDLYLSALHRKYDDLCCLGLHQTDGGAFDFFAMQADMMVGFLKDQRNRPELAARFSKRKASDRPDLSGGLRYVKSARHATYVKKAVFRRYCERIFAEYDWPRYGLAGERPTPKVSAAAQKSRASSNHSPS